MSRWSTSEVVHHRRRRVGDQLRLEIADLIQRELKDPRLGFATVMEVRMTSDLKTARVYVSVMGGDEEEEQTLEVLRRAAGYLRGRIADRLSLRYVPLLIFEADLTVKQSRRIDELLREGEVHRRDAAAAADDGEGREPGGNDDRVN